MREGGKKLPPSREGQPPTVTGSAKARIAQNLTKDNRTDGSCVVDNFGGIQYTKDTKGAAGRRFTRYQDFEVIAETLRG